MKRIIITLLIIIMAFIVVLPVLAASDVIITFKIPGAKVADFRAGFLREHPVPTENVLDANGIPTGEIVPLYTDLQWFKKVIIDYANAEAANGNAKLAAEAANIDKSIAE